MTADAELWDRELAERAPRAPLLRSWGWGEVQSRAGWSGERLRISPGGAMAGVQIRKVGLARGVYVSRGPRPATIEAIDGLVKWARRSRVAKIVVEPEASKDLRDPLKERGFTRTSPTQPQHTRIIKLLPPEKLLTTFRHGRRYNIRAGLKRGVVVEEGKDAAELARQSAAVERRESINLTDRRHSDLLLRLPTRSRTYHAYSPELNAPLPS